MWDSELNDGDPDVIIACWNKSSSMEWYEAILAGDATDDEVAIVNRDEYTFIVGHSARWFGANLCKLMKKNPSFPRPGQP